DGTPHPVAYASRKLTPVEQSYSTREQEALAIVFAIEKFDCYLAGRRFTVITDHRSLSWLMTQPMVKGRLANWAYMLRNYDFTIACRKGSENKLADVLSRAVKAVRVLQREDPLDGGSTGDARRATALYNAVAKVDNGRPRPSRPARIIPQGMLTRKVKKTRTQAAGSELLAHTSADLLSTPYGVGEGFAG